MKRQNVLYPKAAKALKILGENLRLARRRRKITATMMAERANLSVITLRSIERGEPQVSMCNYMAVIACLGFQDEVAAVASNDILGRDLQDAQL
jgi:transcriptional regulator with XRE-family HTH domain